METAGKTLPEMDIGERLAMMSTVTDALEDAAEHAMGEGDVKLMQNFRAMAAILESGSGGLSSGDLKPVELLLTQAVTLLQLYMARTERNRSLH